MARVRFIGDRPLLVPELGDVLAQPDEIYTVPDQRFDAYMLHPDRWEAIEEPHPAEEPTTPPARAAARKAAPKKNTAAVSVPAAADVPAADTAAASTPAGAES